MTRTIKTIIAATALTLSATATAHASDSFTATFKYDANQSAAVNLEAFEATANRVCAQQLIEAGFRKTDSTSFLQRKCERNLVKKAVKGTHSTSLALVYVAKQRGVGKAPIQSQMAAAKK